MDNKVNAEGFEDRRVVKAQILDALINSTIKPHDVIIINVLVLEGRAEGRKAAKYYNLCSDPALNFLSKEMEIVGFPGVRSKRTFEAIRHELVGLDVLIEVIVNEQGYPVFYFRGLPKKDDRRNEPPEAGGVTAPTGWLD